MMVAWMAFSPVRKNRSSIILQSSSGGSLQLITEQQFWLKVLKQSMPNLYITNSTSGKFSAIFCSRSPITLKMLFSPNTSSILMTASRYMTKMSLSCWTCSAWKLFSSTPRDWQQQMIMLRRMQFIPWLYSMPELEEAQSSFLRRGATKRYLAFSTEKDRLTSFSICSTSFSMGRCSHRLLYICTVSSDSLSPEPFLALSLREEQWNFFALFWLHSSSQTFRRRNSGMPFRKEKQMRSKGKPLRS